MWLQGSAPPWVYASAGDRYAFVFRECEGGLVAGSLELDEDRVLLSGGSRERLRDVSIPFEEIADVHIGRQPAERINGYATLVLGRHNQPSLQLAPLGAGLLHEVADLLSSLTATSSARADHLVVVVPLRPGRLDQARTLLEHGPPLDPNTLGLTEHEVYLHEGEATFVFRGPRVRPRIQKAMRTPAIWRAGIAWRDVIACQPRIHIDPRAIPAVQPAYRWTASSF